MGVVHSWSNICGRIIFCVPSPAAREGGGRRTNASASEQSQSSREFHAPPSRRQCAESPTPSPVSPCDISCLRPSPKKSHGQRYLLLDCIFIQSICEPMPVRSEHKLSKNAYAKKQMAF